jgi:hypothetical protein
MIDHTKVFPATGLLEANYTKAIDYSTKPIMR